VGGVMLEIGVPVAIFYIEIPCLLGPNFTERGT